MLSSLLGAILPLANTVIDRLVPDKNPQAKVKAEMDAEANKAALRKKAEDKKANAIRKAYHEALVEKGYLTKAYTPVPEDAQAAPPLRKGADIEKEHSDALRKAMESKDFRKAASVLMKARTEGGA